MALLEDELKYFQTLSDEMAKRIEDRNTSSEASVAYSKIGRSCVRVIAAQAALEAKRTTRSANTTKFQEARQKRIAAKKGTPASAQNAGATSAQQRKSS